MPLRALLCPYCGAPLPPEAKRRVVVCAYCGAAVTWEQVVVRAADFKRALDRCEERSDSTFSVAGAAYRVLGRCGRGESTDVYLGERARRVSERVLLKVLRAADDADLLERQWQTLLALQNSTTRGSQHFSRLLPQPVARGSGILVFRYVSGYVHTLEDVVSAYPGGVDARDAVWMWRRILETLSFLHESKWAHGAILPQHVLVHARDHGVRLVGWSCAGRMNDACLVMSPRHEAFYPSEMLASGKMSPATDLVMTARCIGYVLGGQPGRCAPVHVPQPIAELVNAYTGAAGPAPTHDAWALHRLVGEAAKRAYGPPAYHPFAMPGWN